MKYTTEKLQELVDASEQAELALRLSDLWSLEPVNFGIAIVKVTADDISVTKNRGAPWTTKDVSPNGMRVMARILNEALEVYDSLQDTEKEVSDDDNQP